MKLITISLLLIMLSGCSAFDVLKNAAGLGASKGISVDAQIGDRENELQLSGARGTGKIEAEDNAQVTVNTAQTKFDKTDTVIINETNPWVLGGLVATIVLFIPSPLPKMVRGIQWLANIRQRRSRKASTQKSL